MKKNRITFLISLILGISLIIAGCTTSSQKDSETHNTVVSAESDQSIKSGPEDSLETDEESEGMELAVEDEFEVVLEDNQEVDGF